jgi:hypothetical protein
MKWRLNISAAMLALVLLGLAGIWLSAPRPLDAEVEARQAPALWATHLEEVELALATGDRVRAVRAWTNAWTAALASRRWQPLIDVGDAALRVGDATASTSIGQVNARQAYRAALIRARAQRPVDGVLRAAESFAALGDRHVTEGALDSARKLATGDVTVRARVETDAARIAARVVVQ